MKLVELNAYGNFVGRTRSLPGDGWISLGWAGVALTLAAAGAVLGGLYRLYRHHAGRLFPALAYCAFLPATILWFRGGVITAVARVGLWMLLPVAVWWLLSRGLDALARRRAAQAPLPPPVPEHRR